MLIPASSRARSTAGRLACAALSFILGLHGVGFLTLAAGPIVAEETMPLRRDPQIALDEALAAAVAADTNAALIEFIARHPDEPSAQAGRERLSTRRAPDAEPPPGPDGAIYAAFDAARLDGRAALRAFAGRFPGHPLAREALSPFWAGTAR